MFPRNVSELLPDYMALHSRRLYSSFLKNGNSEFNSSLSEISLTIRTRVDKYTPIWSRATFRIHLFTISYSSLTQMLIYCR
jgi:hypothetical protein